MQRRRVLAALGAGVVGLDGCAAVALPQNVRRPRHRPLADRPAPDRNADRPDTGRHSPGGRPRGRTARRGLHRDPETVPRTYALSPLRYRDDDGGEVRMKVARSATADHPATVVASLTNANSFVNAFRLDWLPSFGRFFSDAPREPGDRWSADDHTYRVGLAFVPTENHDRLEAEDGVERDPETVVLRTDERTAQRVVCHDAERTRFGFDGRADGVRAE